MRQITIVSLIGIIICLLQTKQTYARSKKAGKLCGDVRCPKMQMCLKTNGLPTCGCRPKCPTRKRTLCGTDGNTYLNYCELKRTACVNTKHIRKKYKGRCKNAILAPPNDNSTAHTLQRKHQLRKMPIKMSTATERNNVLSDQPRTIRKQPIQQTRQREITRIRNHVFPKADNSLASTEPKKTSASTSEQNRQNEENPLVCFQIQRDKLRLLLVDLIKTEMRKYGASFADVTAHTLQRCDRNRDRQLDTSEFRNCIEKPNYGRSTRDLTAHVLRSLCVDALIVMSDRNGDWKLNIEEFRSCLHPYYVPPTKRCSLEGQTYSDGSQTIVNCKKCICTCGSWVCTAIVCVQRKKQSNSYEMSTGRKPSIHDLQSLLRGFRVSKSAIDNLIQ